MNIDRIPPDIHFNENGEIVWTPRLIDFNARAYTRGHTVTADEFNTELIKQTYQGNYNTDTINVLTKLYGTVNRNSVVALEKATTAESVSKQALEDVTKVLDNVTDITERAETAVERAEEALATVDGFATDEDISNALKDYYTITEIDDLIKNVEVDLSDYYTKSQTYSREEIDNKISLIPKFSIKVVTALPTENISETTVYLVKDYTITSNLYTEYIYVNGAWETLGVQKVDLSNYYTKEEVDIRIEEAPFILATGTASRPTYNNKDLALYTDVTNLGRFVSVGSTSGTRYYPLVRFNKAISDGNNYSGVFLNGRIGGWGYDNMAYINAFFWGRDKRGGEYTSIGQIKNALARADFVMYEENSTSVVLYLKINGYSLARFSFSGSGEGVTNLYDGTYSSSTPTGTLIASMANGTISEKVSYPIGAIYMSVNNISPGESVANGGLGYGTWEQLKDRFLLGAGSTYSNGATGGSATHTLTVDQIPSHKHNYYSTSISGKESMANLYGYNNSDFKSNGIFALNYTSSSKGYGSTKQLIQNTGGGGSHNNMPPYLVVYMWKRVA